MGEYEHRQALPLPFTEQPEFEFHSDLGSVTLRPVEPGHSPRIETGAGSGGRPQVNIHTEGNVVRITMESVGFFFFGAGRGEGRVILYLPRGVRGSVSASAGTITVERLGTCDLDLRSEAGRVEVNGVAGTLRVHSSAGRIEARDIGPGEIQMRSDAGHIALSRARGRIRLSTSSGTVHGEEISGHLDVQSDLGSVRLDIDALDAGEHRIRTHAGSIRLELARGMQVRVEASAMLGSVRMNYPSQPNAATVLRCSADAGSIRISESERVAPARGPSTPEPRPAGGSDEAIPMPAASTPADEAKPADEANEAMAAEWARRRAEADAEMERILKLVESGELSAEDADELLRALDEQ